MIRIPILFATACLLLFSNLVNAQTIHDLNARLGRGINYGNMFEAPTETEWGNPWQPEYPGIIADLCFDHVRMPIRWEPEERSSAAPPYTITPEFLARVKEVVDATLDEGLHIIINMHHHHDLFDDAAANKDRFLAQWTQISEYFKDYPDSLIFEILNEPNTTVTAEVWNEYLADALDVIRVENPTRAVLIGTANWGGLGGLPDLVLPEDDNIILTIHYYNPFQFTHQGAEWSEGSEAWLGTVWQDTDLERQVVEGEFAPLRALSENEGVAVHIGEFGAYSTADMVSREKWTTYLGRYFEEQGWSWAYWEFSAGFGIYNPSTEQYIDELVNALLHNPMPEPATYERTTIYNSDFSQGVDSWNLNANNGANAQLSSSNNSLNVSISQLGSENWHIQMVRNGFSFEQDKKYSISFTGSAEETRSVGFYAGKASADWNQYGSTNVTLTQSSTEYSAVFDMSTTDSNARLVFDLGSSTHDVAITDIKVEELEYRAPEEPTDPDPPLSLDQSYIETIFPNPSYGRLNIHNIDGYERISIYTATGQKVVTVPIEPGMNTIDTHRWPKGLCFISLTSKTRQASFKVWIK